MLVFIDESGDPGFKFDKGSSLVFVICCVLFSDELEARKTAVAIDELKRELKLPDSLEFKFNLANKKQKVMFLEKINKYSFDIRCLVIPKKEIWSDELKNNKNSFYSYAVKLVLEHSDGDILDAKIRIDGSGDRSFRRNFTAYLRRQLNSEQKCVMKNLKFVDSKSSVLIQLADMIAGSMRRYHEGVNTDKDIYREIIKKHIKDEWVFK